jgi:soluble lytic murein transglycosylase-like protein
MAKRRRVARIPLVSAALVFAAITPALAFENEPSTSLTQLAIGYENGEGVARDLARAHALYCEAASRGDPQASLNLAWMYLNGRGVPREDSIAVYWLNKASDAGLPQAVNLLGLLKGVAPSRSAGCADEPAKAQTTIVAPREIREIVQDIAPKSGLDDHLVLAVISVESAFNTHAVSSKNAKGLMQLMPSTIARFGVKDPFDPRENIRAGVHYLKWLLQRFHGDLKLALAAYNAGEGVVDAYGGVPPFSETITYIQRIQLRYDPRAP